MIRALFWTLALSALTAAALLVPFDGKSLWDRAQDRGVQQAVNRQLDATVAWAKALTEPLDEPQPDKPAPAKKAPQARAAPKAKAPKVAERLTRADRAELDQLIRER